jgi:hypothetical protein
VNICRTISCKNLHKSWTPLFFLKFWFRGVICSYILFHVEQSQLLLRGLNRSMISPIARGTSKVSIFVVVLLFTILLAQQQQHDDIHKTRTGVVTEAFVTVTTPTNIRVTRWNHHYSRRSSPLVQQRLAKNIPDESTVVATASEKAGEVALSHATTESSTPIQDTDTTNHSSTSIANPNTDRSNATASTITSPSPSAEFHVDCDEDDTSEECVFGSEEILGECLPEKLVTLPIHPKSTHVNQLLRNTEQILRNMHINSTVIEMSQILAAKEAGRAHECIYANNYVDLGKIDTYVDLHAIRCWSIRHASPSSYHLFPFCYHFQLCQRWV